MFNTSIEITTLICEINLSGSREDNSSLRYIIPCIVSHCRVRGQRHQVTGREIDWLTCSCMINIVSSKCQDPTDTLYIIYLELPDHLGFVYTRTDTYEPVTWNLQELVLGIDIPPSRFELIIFR